MPAPQCRQLLQTYVGTSCPSSDLLAYLNRINFGKCWWRCASPSHLRSEHQRLNRTRQATDWGGLAVNPKIVGNLLVALVHHHHRYFPIRIDKSSGKQLASAGRTAQSPGAGADEF